MDEAPLRGTLGRRIFCGHFFSICRMKRLLSILSLALPLAAPVAAQNSALDARIAQLPGKRLGVPAEFGATCAFLCSQHAGYINGQNVLIDGGSYPGTY